MEGAGEVSALRITPARPRAFYVLAHGAGAGMRHPFMEAIALRLATHAIGTLRYQFPYTEAGGLDLLIEAVFRLRERMPDLRLAAVPHGPTDPRCRSPS